MGRRIVVTLAVAVLAIAMAPQLVQAAAGVFTSGASATPAVKGTNSAGAGAKGVEGYASGGSGLTYGVYGTSKSNTGVGVYGQNVSTSGTGFAWGLKGQTSAPYGRGLEGYASSSSTTTKHTGVFGVANGGGEGTSGVTGWAKGTGSSVTNGVYGQSDSPNGNGLYGVATRGSGWGALGIGSGSGVVGLGGVVGVHGWTGETGDGTLAVWSENDLGVTGHVLAGGPNFAGTCSFASSAVTTGTSCAYTDAFPVAGGAPIVVVTPAGDPGGYVWVSGPRTDGSGNFIGFTANRSAGTAATTINFVVVGIYSDIAPSSPSRAAHRARIAQYER